VSFGNGDAGLEIFRPPLPLARYRKTEIAKAGDELTSINVVQHEKDSGRDRASIKIAELVAGI
jgi:hypothetical protein